MKFILFFLVSTGACLGAMAGLSHGELLNYFQRTQPLELVILSAGVFALTAFILGWITGETSWVDRLWSTLPVCFVWIYALRSAWEPRLVLLAALVTLWGVRLTFNFARKGGYSRMEDYRWAYLRTVIPNPILWQLFNLLFICGYQCAMFVLFTLPAHVLWQHRGRPFGALDVLALALFLGFLALETVADQQQWNFQQKKLRGSGADPCVKRGFLASGLFRFSRHPNFVGEMGVWWAAYLFSVSATGYWVLNVALLGPSALTLLFQGSTQLTEKLSRRKYPAYAEYQKRTSRLLPWFSRGMDN